MDRPEMRFDDASQPIITREHIEWASDHTVTIVLRAVESMLASQNSGEAWSETDLDTYCHARVASRALEYCLEHNIRL